MANPRQRRKSRSGSSTTPSARSKRQAQKKLVRAHTIKGAKVIQENWDPKMTVRQNYQRLGLIGNLSLRDSGGKENDHETESSSMPESTKKRQKHLTGMAKVERDEDGKIISVEQGDVIRPVTAWGPALNSDDDDEEEDEEEEGGEGSDSEEERVEEELPKLKSEVLQSLEDLSKTVKAVPRFTSQAEKSWLHRLVAKHGSDTAAMSRDRLDNIWQKTEGEIKRAIKKAGGLEALQD